ncbi:pilus assembly protein PilX [Aquabacterium sp.]|uniref:pilus assembly protein PilX n=1 Tax=Aquabacterium sp. TaxID=1872578 RepID=UPI0025C62FBE|nr:pilus assembly protein PilX [Aquabacterium sp.]
MHRTRNAAPTAAASAKSHQAGLSLIFALLALVALSLAGVALVRSVGTGTLVLGNLGFKQSTTASAETATQTAITALQALASTEADTPASGYYASVDNNLLDATGQQITTGSNAPNRLLIAWEANCTHVTTNRAHCDYQPVTVASDASTGTTTQYAIFRMCRSNGAVNTQTCAMPTTTSGSSSTKRGKLDYADYARFGNAASPYFRVIVRVVGERNTVSFTETIVHF